MHPFGHRLRTALDERGPLCVGIDPHPALLLEWGLDDSSDGLATFTMTVVEALAGSVAVLKPQSAFYERHGSAGIAVLERAVAEARSAGALVLLDVKRGDIGSTMQGYADAYLVPSSPLAVDAITVSPYLGFGSLDPVLDTAAVHAAGVFVLALTSNPEGAQVQQARGAAGTVAGQVIAAVRRRNADAASLGSVGLVVGATLEATDEELDVHGPILAPGFGAQGGTGANLRRLFAAVRDQVLPSTSRDVLAAGPSVAALRSAAGRAAEEAEQALR
jgi:orotidine-5'-phosphate decarboxylase